VEKDITGLMKLPSPAEVGMSQLLSFSNLRPVHFYGVIPGRTPRVGVRSAGRRIHQPEFRPVLFPFPRANLRTALEPIRRKQATADQQSRFQAAFVGSHTMIPPAAPQVVLYIGNGNTLLP